MKIRKHKVHEQTAADESEEQQPRCSKCKKKLASTDTGGVCKHCVAAAQRRRVEIVGAIAAGGMVIKAGGAAIKKYGPKVVSLAMKVIKK